MLADITEIAAKVYRIKTKAARQEKKREQSQQKETSSRFDSRTKIVTKTFNDYAIEI